MRAIYIIAEGQTEEEFINEILRPYLNRFEIYDVRAILMETSPGYKGGDVTYQRFKYNVELLLKQETDVIVTSLIDYYKLDTGFPNFIESIKINDKYKRMEFLEKHISDNIQNHRFLPYIQLHEFEGLLFSSDVGFDYLPNIPITNITELKRLVKEYDNPELINNGEETAPSKRLIKLIPGYQKTLHGPIIADEISIDIILKKCSRFNEWINNLIQLYKSN